MHCSARSLALWSFLFSLIAASASAQGVRWQQVGGPEGGGITVMTRAGGRTWAATDRHELFVTTSDGVDGWTRILRDARSQFSSILLAPSGTLFVGTVNGSLYRSTDGGMNWSVNDTIRHSALAADSSGGILLGSAPGVLRSTDDGLTWSVLKDFEIDDVLTLAVAPDGTIVAGVYKGDTFGEGGVHRSTDGGVTWTPSEIDSFYVTPFSGLVATPTGTFMGCSQRARGLYRSTDRGRSWSLVTMPDASPYFVAGGIAVAPSDDLLAVVDTALYRSVDDGATWNRVGYAFTRSPGTAIVAGDYPILVGTAEEGIYRTIDGGTTWTPVNDGLSNVAMRRLAIAPNGTIFSGANTRLYRSTDGGAKWELADASIIYQGAALMVAPNGSVYATTYDTSSGVLRSTDNGSTWKATFFETRELVRALAVAGDGTLYAAVGRTAIRRSTDNGETWSFFRDITGIIPSSLEVDATGDLWLGSIHGMLYRFSRSDTSRKQYRLSFNTVTDIVVGRNGRLFASTEKNGVNRSTDGGASWSSVNAGLADSSVASLLIDRAGALWVATAFRGIQRSTDDGATWEQWNEGLSDTMFHSLALDSLGYVHAGSESSGLYRSLTNSGVDDAEEQAATPLVLGNAPNPFGSVTRIAYELAAAGQVTVVVLDGLGRPVATLVDGKREAGAHVTVFDASDHPSGVYLCRLTVDGKSVTRPIVLMR